MGCDIHMAVDVREVSGFTRSDEYVRELERAVALDPTRRRQLEAISVRGGAWECVAIETWCPGGGEPLLPTREGWRAHFEPWPDRADGTPSPYGDYVATKLDDMPTPWWESRDYEAFARLAGVRNREDVAPISEPRGLPSDFSPPAGKGADDFEIGDHSMSWLLASEIAGADAFRERVHRSGLVSRACYDEWKALGASDPREWCQYVGGPGVRVFGSAKEAASAVSPVPNHDYIRCDWFSDRTWGVVEMAKAWANRFGGDNVRFVFGFDS